MYVIFQSTYQILYELEPPFHHLGLQVDCCSRGRSDARKKKGLQIYVYSHEQIATSCS